MSNDHITAFTGARIFDGARWHHQTSLVVDGDTVRDIGPAPEDARIVDLGGGLLAPGFVDLQVNGGGGLLVGPTTTADDLARICAVHAQFGVTALLPTLITDAPHVVDQVLDAGIAAARRDTPGFLGLHLEGPHLSVARKGAHDPQLLRPMDEADLLRLERVRPLLPHLLVTVAAETVTPMQIARMVRAGIIVSVGHSDASYDVASVAFRAGATMTTHLFNAMSQLGNRDPGVVGAALDHGGVSAGLIADGIHVHPATFAIARRAKRGPGEIFLVSDSMSQAGTDLDEFALNGRTIYRRDNALRLNDGTLAGADLTMDAAVHFANSKLKIELDDCLRMSSLYAGKVIVATDLGVLRAGLPASFVHLDNALVIRNTWLRGVRTAPAAGTAMKPASQGLL